MAPKAPDAFRTISEVADWLGVSTHVLRFWESKFPQIKPVKRAGGRRYYRPADMELLGGLRKLLHDDGLTVKGAQKILKEQGVKAVSALSPPVDIDPPKPVQVSRSKPKKPAPTAPSSAQTTDDAEADSAVATPVATQEALAEPEPSVASVPSTESPLTEDPPVVAEETSDDLAASTAAGPDSAVVPELDEETEGEAEAHPEENVQPDDAPPAATGTESEPSAPPNLVDLPSAAEEVDTTTLSDSEAGSEPPAVIPFDAQRRGATGSPIFSAPPASLTEPADKAPEEGAEAEALPLFSRRRLPESLPGAEPPDNEVTEPPSNDVPDHEPPESRQPESDAAPVSAPESAPIPASDGEPLSDAGDAPEQAEAESDHDAPLPELSASQPKDLRIAPLPDPDLTLAERLERLVPGQIPADRLRPIHSRLLALRDRMGADHFTG